MTSPPGPLPCEGRGRRMAPSATAGHVGAALAAAPCFSILRGSSLWCNPVISGRKTADPACSGAVARPQRARFSAPVSQTSFCSQTTPICENSFVRLPFYHTSHRLANRTGIALAARAHAPGEARVSPTTRRCRIDGTRRRRSAPAAGWPAASVLCAGWRPWRAALCPTAPASAR